MDEPVKRIRLILLIITLAFGYSQEDSTIFDGKIRVRKPNESKTVTIIAQVNPIEVSPTAYRLSIYHRNRPAEMLIQKIFFPTEPIQIILPEDILNTDSLGNVARLEPMGDHYLHQFRMFDVVTGEIRLAPFDIHVPMDIVKLFIMDGSSANPIPQSKVSVSQDGEILTSTVTDTSGYTRVRITAKRKMNQKVLFAIDTEGSYSPWRGRLEVPEGISEKVIKIEPLKLEKGESIYQVRDHLAPFREGPENGAKVHFFLHQNEHVAISKVAGDRLFGRIRVYIDTQDDYMNVTGWILRKHLSRKEKL